ncbi:MAG: nuclear transport factor 2 family protein [Acidovorax sp.]|nr:MAG: nuclear transport factor 2 family protein [Acidovorax sp.]
MSAAPDFAGVTATLNLYFDGLYHCDTARLAQAFHPTATYYCATEGRLLHLDMKQYFPIVDQRTSPASQGHGRRDSILSIEFAGPVTAFARVECAIAPRFFTDFLTLVRLDERWQIVSKVFHFDVME